MTDLQAPSGRQFPISAAGQHAVIVEVGGGVREYGTQSRPVLAGYPESAMQPHSAGAVLVPWPNRVSGGRYTFEGTEHQLGLTEPPRENAIHGLARWVRWEVVGQTDDAIELSCDLPPQMGYPFHIRTSVRWTVGPDGLRADHRARNLGEQAAPFGLGTHPYLHLGNAPIAQTALRLPAATRLIVDDRNRPVGREPVAGTAYDLRTGPVLADLSLDTAYTDLDRGSDGRVSAVLQLPDGAGTEVWMDGSYEYLQAYTAPNFAAGMQAVAVEPMTCAPDAFNSGDGLVVLGPGEEWSGSWGMRPTES